MATPTSVENKNRQVELIKKLAEFKKNGIIDLHFFRNEKDLMNNNMGGHSPIIPQSIHPRSFRIQIVIMQDTFNGIRELEDMVKWIEEEGLINREKVIEHAYSHPDILQSLSAI